MLATHVDVSSTVHLPVPAGLSMQDAASVFVPYGTALYALVVKARVVRGQSVLVHNAATVTGQVSSSSRFQTFTTRICRRI